MCVPDGTDCQKQSVMRQSIDTYASVSIAALTLAIKSFLLVVALLILPVPLSGTFKIMGVCDFTLFLKDCNV
jgi:hypothetical protein